MLCVMLVCWNVGGRVGGRAGGGVGGWVGWVGGWVGGWVCGWVGWTTLFILPIPKYRVWDTTY